uniref:Uncharacterized protein n=1 Tax=Rhizophora mucronata TaxID=61149 RepID=A0A2P2NDT3_RHIMU
MICGRYYGLHLSVSFLGSYPWCCLSDDI